MRRSFEGDSVRLISADGILPLRVVCSSSWMIIFGNLAMALAALVLAFNIDALLPLHLFGAYEPLISDYLPLLLAAAAVFLLLRGLLRLAARTTIEVDEQTVNVQASFHFWARRWSEPLANYQGVRLSRYAIHRHHTVDSTFDNAVRYRHVIELVHATNTRRTVPLCVSETAYKTAGEEAAADGDNPRPRWEALATLLRLPAIDARDGIHEIREVADLDKSVRELSDEGKLEVDWQGSQPPRSLQIEQRGDPDVPASQELHITIHAANLPKIVLYMLGGLGAILCLTGLATLDIGALFAGLLFGGAGYAIWYLQRKNPHRLTITREQIRYEDPLVATRCFALPLRDVESIKIRDRDSESAHTTKTLKLSGKELLISSDSSEFSAGGGLDNEALQWLRDYLVAAVARA